MIRTRRDRAGVVRSTAVVMLATAIAMSAGSAIADSSDTGIDGSYYETEAPQSESQFGVNAASAGLSLIYAPVKLAYSTLGLVFGGIAYGLSGGDSDVLNAVVTPAIQGDYLIQPKHIRREEDVEFFGRDPAYREDEVVDSAVFEETY